MLAPLVVLFSFALLVLGAGVYAVVAVARPPSHTPQTIGPKRDGARRVVFLGASLVQGTISASFVDLLRRQLGPSWEVVNAGRNGELAWNASRRVDEVVGCEPDEVIVLVGSNDVMASLGLREERRYRRLMKIPQAPSLGWYRENLARIVDGVRSGTGARVALCSLPFLGENLASEVNVRLRRYNQAIEELAREKSAGFIDLYEVLSAELARRGEERGRDFPRGLRLMLRTALLRKILGWRFDRIGRLNGFALLTDGVHVGETAAALIADRLERWLTGEEIGG